MANTVCPLELAWENLDEAFAKLEADVTDVVRGLTVSAWKSVLRHSPQYHGRMVVSWTYSLNAPVFEDRSDMAPPHTDGPFSKGDGPAIGVANRINYGADRKFRLGDTVFISNGADHGEGAYAGLIEAGQVRLRAVNYPGKPVDVTTSMLKARYGVDVNARQAAQLRRLTIDGDNHAG